MGLSIEEVEARNKSLQSRCNQSIQENRRFRESLQKIPFVFSKTTCQELDILNRPRSVTVSGYEFRSSEILYDVQVKGEYTGDIKDRVRKRRRSATWSRAERIFGKDVVRGILS